MRVLISAAGAMALAALAVPQAAAQTITPTLSTTMQRVCAAQTTTTNVFDASGTLPTAPSVVGSTRTFYATRSGDGYGFVQGAQQATGDITLRANVGANGDVSWAEISGPGAAPIAAAMPPAEFTAMAQTLARDIPERLMVGRTFRPGEQLYPGDLGEQIIGELTRSFGLPFPVTGNVDVPYIGEATSADGSRVWVWEGRMAMSGSGLVQGRVTLGLNATFLMRVEHDVETALVRMTSMDGTVSVTANGQRTLETRTVDGFTCRISPQ